MIRVIASLAVLLLLSACEKAPAPAPTPDAPKNGTVQAPAPAPTPAPAPAATAPAATETPAAPVAEVPKVDTVVPPNVSDAAKEAAAAATELPKELAAAVEPTTTLDKLKELIAANVSIDTLKTLADKLLQALQGQEGAAKGIKDQIAGLSLTDLAKGAELKNSLETTTTTIGGLKDKLKAVADKLQAGGVDVSKYTSLLSK